MKNINALVTGIGGPIAQGVIQGLKERGDVTVIGVDRRSMTAGNHFCDRTHVVPRYTDTENYLSVLKSLEIEESIDIIFPTLHEEILFFDEFRAEFEALVAVPESDDFPVLMDKEQTYSKLTDEGLSKFVPLYKGFYSSDELKDIKKEFFNSTSKFVVKSVDSYASVGFAILASRKDYIKAMKSGLKNVLAFKDYCKINSSTSRKIAMKYFPGNEYSVDVFVYDNKVVTAVPRERNGVSNNIVLDGKVVHNKELIEASTEVTEKLIDNGFINVQFMESDDGFQLTDVNPRFCGSQVMSLGAGVNFPSLFIDYIMLNKKTEVDPVWNTRMLRFRDQVFVHEN